MKSEREIREFQDSMIVAIEKPCGCAGGQHAMECKIGGRMMAATIVTLSWILGECDEHQDLVDEMNRDIRDYRASQN